MTDDIEVIGNEVFPLPVMVYGRPEGDGTAIVRERLKELQISFVEIDIDEDEGAARYVQHINHGALTTPTIVFGDEDFIIVEPTTNELIQALRRAGYQV